MLELWIYMRAYGIPNLSPFCMKAETWLRMTGLEHSVRFITDPSEMKEAPKGKFPVLRDGDEIIADSEFIIDHPKAKYDVDPDASLDAQQLAMSHAIRRMIEEHYYWAIGYTRWIEPAVWPYINDVWFGHLNKIIGPPIAWYCRKLVRRDLWGHGLGRHCADDVYLKAGRDAAALSEIIGDREFVMGGDEPTTLDATAYAFLANTVHITLDTPFNHVVKKHANLVKYCDGMRDRYFADDVLPEGRPTETS